MFSSAFLAKFNFPAQSYVTLNTVCWHGCALQLHTCMEGSTIPFSTELLIKPTYSLNNFFFFTGYVIGLTTPMQLQWSNEMLFFLFCTNNGYLN